MGGASTLQIAAAEDVGIVYGGEGDVRGVAGCEGADSRHLPIVEGRANDRIVDHAAHLGQHPGVVEHEHVRRIEGGQAIAPLFRILVERDGAAVVRREVTRPRQGVRGTELDPVDEVPVGLHLQRVVVRMARVFEDVEIAPAAIRPEEIVRQRISGTRRVCVGRVEARAERDRIDVALLEEVTPTRSDVGHVEHRAPAESPAARRR